MTRGRRSNGAPIPQAHNGPAPEDSVHVQSPPRGRFVHITCIYSYPQDNLYKIPKVRILKDEIQNINIGFFYQLHEGDILFIDSTHILKIDGDVPYLYLEIIPRLENGVIIHIHDIHFPYNIPYPPQYYIFGNKRPVFWNEAMLLQAFNTRFIIILYESLCHCHYCAIFVRIL